MGQVACSNHGCSVKYFLVDCEVADEIVGLFVADSQIVNFAEAQLFILSKSVAVLGFEVRVGEVVNEILANIAQRYHIFQFWLELGLQDLKFSQLRHFFFR